jgi:uncharacterized repeat protein (TIGR03803 family)
MQMATIGTLVTFGGPNGEVPFGGLTSDVAGNLFGTTLSGGANGDGTVFEIAKTDAGYASAPISLVSFDGSNGQFPTGGLIADAAGNLFGTTQAGGETGDGTVFEIAKTVAGYASLPITLISFNATNGATPFSSLIADATGNLFGTTSGGGANDAGTVFEVAKTDVGYATTPISLVSFDGSNGQSPTGGLIADAAGNLFGTAQGGGAAGAGTVFEISKTNGSYASIPTTLISFDGSNGRSPAASLVADAVGNLFGTTTQGGTNDAGTVFEIIKTNGGYASTPTTLVSFDGADGQLPTGNLIADATGSLFGTTSAGGARNVGTVFEVSKADGSYASTPITLASFDGTNGITAKAGLIADASGNLFGTTLQSTVSNFGGTVFEITDTGFQAFLHLCFLRGTRILTPTGEVPVESLSPGDLVTTLSGAHRALRWIGSGQTLITQSNRDRASPVVVRRDAIADGVPHRDLYLTRGHSLLIDGVLIPVEGLVNHRSIAWVKQLGVVEYYHPELDGHDVILAEGAPAETYRDDGNSTQFQNIIDRPATQPVQPCAPIVNSGPAMHRIWDQISRRAGVTCLPQTDDPDLHLLADGVRVDGKEMGDRIWRFQLGSPVSELRIISRSAIPSALGNVRDHRRLGVALRRVAIAHIGVRIEIGWDAPCLEKGFNDPEPLDCHRWTNGDASLPPALLAMCRSGTTVELQVNCLLPYPLPTIAYAA